MDVSSLHCALYSGDGVDMRPTGRILPISEVVTNPSGRLALTCLRLKIAARELRKAMMGDYEVIGFHDGVRMASIRNIVVHVHGTVPLVFH